METIEVAVWIVTQGDESSAGLRELNVSRERAKKVFEQAASEIDDASVRLLPCDGLQVGNGADWVRLESRAMTVTVADLIRAIAEATTGRNSAP